MYHHFRSTLLFATLASLLYCQKVKGEEPEGEPAQRPNIVFIFADDLGWTDLACYGSGYHQTPHLDSLAEEGIRFTDAYSCSANCAPTRACLMTGQYTPRHGTYTVRNGERGNPNDLPLIPPQNITRLTTDYETLAERLQSAGYRTIHIGKWHLGDSPENGPCQHGFDINIGGSYSGAPRHGYFSPYRLPELPNGPRGEFLTDRLTDEAVQFIDAHADERFFLYLPHYAVHAPLEAREDYIEAWNEREGVGGHHHAVYGAMLQSLDDSVGRVIEALEAHGLRENTLILFASDNGGVGGYSREGIINRHEPTDNAPLRGGKGMFYEGGIRVPMIASWPGKIEPGLISEELVITVDIYPTLCNLAQIEEPAPHPIDGADLCPLFFGEGGETLDRSAIYWHFPGYLQAMKGTWRTKPVGIIRQGDWKLHQYFEGMRIELYNLADDIGEQNNLAETHPEIVARLTEQLHAWRESVGASVPPRREGVPLPAE